MSNSASPWPVGCEGAVSLTFDDGMGSQLLTALPILTESGLFGTFYVNPRDARGVTWEQRIEPWIPVAAAGHEIGNHTVNHICSRNFCFDPDRTLETATLEQMEWEVAEGKRRLLECIPEQPEMSFCYPCYQEHVGEGPTRQSYVPVVARHHAAGRGRGEWPNHPLLADLHYLGSFGAERMSGPEMVGYAERAATQGRWTILTFHGINEGGLAVSEADFRELVKHLARHRQRIWTAPVRDVAARIIEYRKQVGQQGGDRSG